MNKKQLTEIIKSGIKFEPTKDQLACIDKLSEFLLNGSVNSVFLLKGYAGTGKTTLVSVLVNILPMLGASSVLLAPTGRAAKVIAGYSRKQASTIHKKIYRLNKNHEGTIHFQLQPNKHSDTYFIVDEGSMISDGNSAIDKQVFSSRNLLDDLTEFVYSGKNCRLILVGDSAQLPPVGMDESPAMNEDYLKITYHLEIWSFELKNVVRQEAASGILHNATLVRNKLAATNPKGFIKFELKGFSDVFRVQGQEAVEKINEIFSYRDFINTTVLCRSNKKANLYNQFIRNRVLFYEDEIAAGDLIMVVKNNYYWLPEESQASFIANGDILHVNRVKRVEELYGFRFATITGRLIDYTNLPDIDVIVLLDTLHSNGPSLTIEESTRLFDAVLADHADEPSKKKRFELIKSNPYFNALQVKFAYAITCHKAQGGQWENVFVDMGYFPENTPDFEYYRWLYTAFTRATKKLYLMGFTDTFF